MGWGDVRYDIYIGIMWIGTGSFSVVRCGRRHSGEFNQKKNDLAGRNLCGSTTFFVFAGNWIPVEMDWFPLNFWKYGSHGQNRQCTVCEEPFGMEWKFFWSCFWLLSLVWLMDIGRELGDGGKSASQQDVFGSLRQCVCGQFKKHHETSWCKEKLFVFIAGVECHKTTEQHCPRPETMLFHSFTSFPFNTS